MSELDVERERIAYLKLWLGVLVVTNISLFGWLVSSATTEDNELRIFGFLGVLCISVGIGILHYRIERRILGLKDL